MRQGDEVMLEDSAISNDTFRETMLPDSNELNVQSGVNRLNDMPGSHGRTIPKRADILHFIPGVGWTFQKNSAGNGYQGNHVPNAGSYLHRTLEDADTQPLDDRESGNSDSGTIDDSDALRSSGVVIGPLPGLEKGSGTGARNGNQLSRSPKYFATPSENGGSAFDWLNVNGADSESAHTSLGSAKTLKRRRLKPCAPGGAGTFPSLRISVGVPEVRNCSATK